MKLNEKIIVITGAASGIGEAMAIRFSAEKPKKIIVVDQNEKALQKVVKKIHATGGVLNSANEKDMHTKVSAAGYVVDVSSNTQIKRMIDHIEEHSGNIDLFCSNAGVSLGGELDTADEIWEKIWKINTMSHVYAARELIPRMIKVGGGYLLNTSSAAGLLTQVNSATYSVTKHAAVSFAEWVAINYGHQGIKVSLLCPQAVNTPMIAGHTQGGVAGVDGIMEPSQVADKVVEGLALETFLILPHSSVYTYMQRKVSDYDRWLKGMRRLRMLYIKDSE